MPLKGIVDLLMAARYIPKKYSIHFLMVGDGPLRRNIIRIAKSEGVSLTITGWVSDPEKYYSIMDVFVLPSYSEGFPRTCLEAMAMEKPLIVTNVGENKYIIKDGKNGFMILPGNSELLAKRIITLIENRSLIKKWGKRNREIVKKSYTLE